MLYSSSNSRSMYPVLILVSLLVSSDVGCYRKMWTSQLPLDSAEQYTALLGVKEADPLDQGTYTCQVSDWGYQQCQSVVLKVLQAPRIRIDPMTVTVEKVG